MAELKTKEHDGDVEAFLQAVADPARRDDCHALVRLLREVTGEEPRMWGPSIVGFGRYHYVYDSGHSGDSCLAGFSPRKANLTIYLCAGLDRFAPQLARLGKFKAGKGCLYVKRLADIDTAVLREIVAAAAAAHLEKK